MTISIGISGMFRPDQLAGGPYSFFENLLRGFAALGESDGAADFDLAVFHGRTAIPYQNSRFRYRAVPDRLGRFAAHAWVGAVGARGLRSVLFPNYFTPPVVRAERAAAVIHDLQFRHMPKFFSPVKWRWLDACHRFTLSKCDAVVAISDVVRNDILNEYGSRWESRVTTIHNPVSIERFDGADAADSGSDVSRFTGGRPYVMCAAMDRPQKNLHTLVRAFHRIKDRFPDHVLVLVGQLRRLRPDRREKAADIADKMPSCEDLVNSLGIANRVIVTGFVSDAQLGAFYRGSAAFVLPSLFEGFGMTAAEAMALGAPALVSDLPVLREVTLGGARYVANPTDDAALAEQLSAMLDEGAAARPTPELSARIRGHYAPATIARQYYDLLVG